MEEREGSEKMRKKGEFFSALVPCRMRVCVLSEGRVRYGKGKVSEEVGEEAMWLFA